jgi:outer membrane protein OmpA-like peptidoglycan-associated protein
MSAIDEFSNRYIKPTTGIQKALKQLGYDPGTIDGTMAGPTQAAIRKFQQDNGLTPDGSLTPKTQAALAKALQGRMAAGGAPTNGAGRGSHDSASTPANATVQSLTVKAPGPGSGGEWNDASTIKFSPSAQLNVDGGRSVTGKFGSGRYASVEMEAGKSGKLVLEMIIDGFEDNFMDNETFKQRLSVTWDIAADETGALTIEPPEEIWGAPTTGTFYRLDSVNPSNGKTYVQVSPIIVGGSEGGSVTPFGVGVNKQSQPPKIRQTFKVDIKVKVPEPKGTVTVGNEATAIAKFDYVVGPFKPGSSTLLETGTLKKAVYDILNQMLPGETRKEILNGKLAGGEKIEVHGYASNTDTQERNFSLSKKRAAAVLAEFRSLGAPASLFTEPIPHGEWESNPTDDKKQEKEDANWRKVVLKIQHEMTFEKDPATGEMRRVK